MENNNNTEVNDSEIIDDDVENPEDLLVPGPESDDPEEEEEYLEDEDIDEDDEEELDSSTSDVQSQPKPVDGETPREKALRLEIQRLRKKGREAKKTDTGGRRQKSDANFSDYSQDELERTQKLLDDMGYVNKEDMYQQTVDTVLGDFIADHPEYSEADDEGDVMWGILQNTILSDYNIMNKTPGQLRRIYEKAHRDITDEDEPVTVKRNVRALAAQKQKMNSASHTGGTKKKSSNKKTKTMKMDSATRGMFKDFSDEDFAE